MRAVLLAALALAAPGCAAVDRCEFADHDLLGGWVHVSGPSFFQEIAFERDETGQWFRSWLHERPEIPGAPWRVEECRLTIAPDDGTSPWVFTEVRQRGKTLLLRESAGGEPWIFERVPE
jgi:hypothetical protein